MRQSEYREATKRLKEFSKGHTEHPQGPRLPYVRRGGYLPDTYEVVLPIRGRLDGIEGIVKPIAF